MSDISANEVLRAAMFAAVCDAIEAYKANSNGVANVLLRDLAGVHSNTAFGDLPKNVQKSIQDATDSAFRSLLKEGFVIQPKDTAKPRGRTLNIPTIPKHVSDRLNREERAERRRKPRN